MKSVRGDTQDRTSKRAKSDHDRLDALLSNAVQTGVCNDVVGIAVNRTTRLYSGGFTNRATLNNRVVDEDSIFRIASLTKVITTLGVIRLIQQRALNIDDAAGDYVPEIDQLKIRHIDSGRGTVHSPESSHKRLTIRHLLTHTSGIGYNFTDSLMHGELQNERTCLAFEPGTRWLYGGSTEWLGRIIERRTKKTLDEFFTEEIFEPLQMLSTSFEVRADKLNRLVAPTRRSIGGGTVFETVSKWPLRADGVGDSGLFSTPNDFINVVEMILGKGYIGKSRFLNDEGIRLLTENQIGSISVPRQTSVDRTYSEDFSFISHLRDKWSAGFLLSAVETNSGPSVGTMSWGGIFNTFIWIDCAEGVGGIFFCQLLPFADAEILSLKSDFEAGVHALGRSWRASEHR